MSRYTSTTPEDLREMLAAIGVGSLEDLFERQVPAGVRLGRPAAVWFVGAADPVAFKPRRWCFPIVGCFAGLGWFDEDDGVAAAAFIGGVLASG